MYRIVMSHNIGRVCKVARETNSQLQKWDEEFGEL